VIAGPMLLNERPASEMFFSESGSELFCAVTVAGNNNNKLKAIEVINLCIVVTLN
jgi:hypothetical protein